MLLCCCSHVWWHGCSAQAVLYLLLQVVEVVLHESAGQQVQLRAYLHALQLSTDLYRTRWSLPRGQVRQVQVIVTYSQQTTCGADGRAPFAPAVALEARS
jgi:hypothetical protein